MGGSLGGSGHFSAAESLPAMGDTKLQRLLAAQEMLNDWDMDCKAITDADEKEIGPIAQNIFRGIRRDIDVGLTNLQAAIEAERAINPQDEKRRVKKLTSTSQKRFRKRKIVPPSYDGILVSIQEMADHMKVSRGTVYNDVRKGKLPMLYRWGNKAVFLITDLEQCMRVPVAWKRKEPLK